MNTDTGNALWIVLHAYALAYPWEPDPDDINGAEFFFGVFTKLVVERSTKSCRRCDLEWQKIMKICPPDFSGRARLYEWTVAAHDRINRKLNKPLHRPELSLQHVLLTTP